MKNKFKTKSYKYDRLQEQGGILLGTWDDSKIPCYNIYRIIRVRSGEKHENRGDKYRCSRRWSSYVMLFYALYSIYVFLKTGFKAKIEVIGYWHSHPSLNCRPSAMDNQEMSKALYRKLWRRDRILLGIMVSEKMYYYLYNKPTSKGK